jgi:hypothetical protein
VSDSTMRKTGSLSAAELEVRRQALRDYFAKP